MKLLPHKANRLLLVVSAMATSVIASAFCPTFYKEKSVLASGNWVKIKVVDNGIYQFTADQLREMGFSDPSKVVVCGYGGAALTSQRFNPDDPDDLPQTPVVRTDDGRILFYGEGPQSVSLSYNQYYHHNIRTNYSSTAGYYFLTDSQSPSSLPRVSRNVSNTDDVTTHTAIEFYDFNEANPGQGGARFFSRNIIETGNRPLTFTVTAPIAGSTRGYVSYTSVAKSGRVEPRFSVTFDNDIKPGASTHNSGLVQTTDLQIFSRLYGYQYFALREEGGSNEYTVTVAPNSSTAASTAFSYGANDWVFFSYPSYNTLADRSQRIMHFPNVLKSQRIKFSLDDASTKTLIWDITDVTNIRQFNTFRSSTNQLWLTPDKSYNTSDSPALRAIAFDPQRQFPTPEVVGAVDNQNLHAMPTPHMLIITNETCYDAAQRLAQAHRELQGIDVVVAKQSEVFNEFSSGTPDVMAYRRVAKMFFDRDTLKFRSLLLFGHGIYDNRQIAFKANDALLTYQTDDYTCMGHNATNYVSDDYFGFLDDYYNPVSVSSTKMDIAVGRIPSQTKPDVVVDKIIRHMSTPIDRPYRNNVLAFADDNDANKHERQAELVIEAMAPHMPATTFTKVFNNVYPWRGEDAYEGRQQIIQSLSQGQDYVMYVGHGNAEHLTLFNYMWHKKYAESVPYSHLPIWTLATCDSYAFDRLSDGIAEAMLYNPNGGAIAVVGSSRTVYADSNHYLNLAMGKAIAQASGKTTIGQLYRQAQNEVMSNPIDVNIHINTMAYNLLGDPEVPYLGPEHTIKVTAINNHGADTDPTLYPLSTNTIQGVVVDTIGNILDKYNGLVTISVYESPVTIMSTPKDGKSDPREVKLDETLLGEVTAVVTNGKFTAECVLPQSLRPDQDTRLTLWAIDDSHSSIATGLCTPIKISSSPSPETAVTDVTAPVISQMYLDDESFVDGNTVGNAPTLYAEILADPSGFNVAKGTIGSSATLTLDNKTSYPGVRGTLAVRADGSASIQFPLSDLQDGRHYLTLGIGDNMGNRSSRTLNFVVVNNEIQSTLSIDRKHARTEVTFDIDHNFESQPTGRLIIEDAQGHVIHTVEAVNYPYTWNLKTASGSDVPSGTYRCYTLLNNDKRYSATPRIPLTIVR